ncbi:MAG: hypothetical protein JNK79_02305 [Chitinophagaceae bacterium]|nr:hypothetical protein [Chitinophagaceae bacterium]
MKTRFYIFLIAGIVCLLVQLLLIAFVKETGYPLINDRETNAYNFGTLLFFFVWSVAAIPLLIRAYRLNKKIKQKKFETDNFLS